MHANVKNARSQYLPDRFKDHLQSDKAKPALRHRAERRKPLYPSKEVLGIRSYTITKFVNILIKKPLHEQLEEKARKLETTPDKRVYNAILLILRT
jgi:hypothetical protein